jgi:hypothetical protein
VCRTRTDAQLIDGDTPQSVRSRTGFDGQTYQLVFSDEFNKAGRTFKAGRRPFWEAVNLFDSKSADLQWYEPGQSVPSFSSRALSPRSCLSDRHVQVRSRRRMATLLSPSPTRRPTGCSTSRACSRAGINFASPRGTLRSPSNSLGRRLRLVCEWSIIPGD